MRQKSFLPSSHHHLLIKSYHFIFFCHLAHIAFSSVDSKFQSCQPQSCGNGPNISFPFYIREKQPEFCGYPRFDIFCGINNYPMLNLSNNHYIIHEIFYNNDSLRVSDPAFSSSNSTNCFPRAQNLRLYGERFDLAPNQTDLFLLFGCDSKSLPLKLQEHRIGCSKGDSSIETGSLLGFDENGTDLKDAMQSNKCENRAVKTTVEDKKEGVLGALRRGFRLKWTATNCSSCEQSGGKCGFDREKYSFQCYCPDRPHSWHCRSERRTMALKLGLGLGLGLGFPAIVIGLFIGLVHKRKYASSNIQFHSRDSCSDPYSDESSFAYFGIPVFSYEKLEEATNNFDRTRELGDGGFGTVYYGKLQDGREVAVKRLYEHNYRRVQQFMNEVKILTHLHHKNLVSLYGCTSHQSRELLLVYEYIPNGTVACHLHGDLAKPGLMPWHVRMKIAVETASALVYLHASDIIHRDVKTNNILLDNNFCVKVADFGLSRMFPNDVTHVSTAPQGTPGYVDPEYYRCYQLTSKSDVYSFGVVLIELISSMPAVDMSRHNDEINLSDLAVKKIKKSAFSELVDPSLGFESDNDVKRMIILVAQLAFQCLQREKDLRPSMDEVLKALKSIESGEDEPDHLDEADVQDAGTSHCNIRPVPPSSPEWDEVGLLKNMNPPRSPNTVTHNWESKSTTPNVSGYSLANISFDTLHTC